MKITVTRRQFLEAFADAACVAPTRSSKPILQSVLLRLADGEAVLVATDLEVGLRRRVLGVTADLAGSVVLPTAKFAAILRTSNDETLSIEAEGGQLIVRGLRSRHTLNTEDPALFPEMPGPDGKPTIVVIAAELRKMIRRTSWSTDLQSTRYALGGCLFEAEAARLTAVGTDGRRLARMSVDADNSHPPGGTQPVIPVKALKVIDRALTDDHWPVHVALRENHALIETEDAVVYTRLVVGRYPAYRDVFPAGAPSRATVEAGLLLAAVEQSAILTSDESRGVVFDFTAGSLRMSSQAADVGSGEVELPIRLDGPDVSVTIDVRYLVDMLRAVEPAIVLSVEVIDHKNPAVFRCEDGYEYVVMPLTRDQ